MIAKIHVTKVCKLGRGSECCSYLVLARGGFECAKDRPSMTVVIDQRRERNTIGAKGDNCDGWTVVKERN
jgi:hypothetical protein